MPSPPLCAASQPATPLYGRLIDGEAARPGRPRTSRTSRTPAADVLALMPQSFTHSAVPQSAPRGPVWQLRSGVCAHRSARRCELPHPCPPTSSLTPPTIIAPGTGARTHYSIPFARPHPRPWQGAAAACAHPDSDNTPSSDIL